ncbi:MAG TPA: hypothetical protein VI819_01910 [Patescibacteria group bacterium]|nr:hypothetical protein [Patescibacteria group bacterium]
MEKLGIDLFSIGVQIVNFFLLLFILKKFLYKPVLEMIKKKQKEEDELNSRKIVAATDLEKANREADEIVTNAKTLQKSLLDEARKKAESEAKKTLEEADEKAKDLIKNAQKQAEIEAEKKLKNLSSMVRNELKSILTQSLPEILTQKQISEITEKALRRLKNYKKNDNAKS